MNSIREEVVALDTNQFIFALRQDINYPNCRKLLFDKLNQIKVYLPLQVLIELRRNLTDSEMRKVMQALSQSKSITWDYALAPKHLIQKWEQKGAKKGDAVITAHLEVNNIKYLISENRHFLSEIPNLPFNVLSSAEIIKFLG